MPVFLKKPKTHPLFPCLIGILLFTSGLLVPVTPLAYIYVSFTSGQKRFWQASLISLGLVALIYGLILAGFDASTLAESKMSWLVSLPGLSLLTHFPPLFVALFGVGQFAFFLAVAFAVSRVLATPLTIYAKSLRAVLGISLALLIVMTVFLLPQAKTFLQSYQTAVTETVNVLASAADTSSGLEGSEAVYFKTALQYWAKYSLYVLPMLFLFSVSFVYVLNLTLAKRLFFPFRPELLFVKFTEFRLSFSFVWGVIFVLAVFLLNLKFFGSLVIGFVAFNLLGGALLLYFYQGLSILVFLLDRIRLRGLWRILAYFVFVYLFFITSALTTLFGFFDSWLDVRKRLTLKQL